MKRLKPFGLACGLVAILLSGCSQDQNMLERIGYIQSAAYDLAPKGDVKVTISIPLVTQFARDGRTTDELLSTVAHSSKEANKKLSLQTSRLLVSGQIRALLFGVKLAQQGLQTHMDTFLRDPSFSKRTPVVVVDGDSGDLISHEYPRHTKTSNYIEKLLQKEFSKQIYPRILLHEFIRDLNDDGQDPIATMIRETKNGIEMSGVALFRKDRFITKLSPEDVFIFSLMYHSINRGEFTIATENPELRSVSFNVSKSKRKIKVSRTDEGEYQVNIGVKVQASIMEYIGTLRLSTSDRAKAEQLINESIANAAERIIHNMQKNRVDSLGIGKYVRNKMSYSEWKKTDWHDMYSKMPIHVQCSFIIKNYGNYVD
ncbi:Ger(x)C family spore germination protein [Paenibacillus puldeungensis]|uniref:Ger(X)C family spore germination protein n=1 Tax=Paenibacillus puldeungensis TaxID=696536 RepID=A0ABW3RRI1_9BACL